MKKDRELIQDFQNGDEEAFNELVRRYLDLVHGFFQKLTNDEMEAEDLETIEKKSPKPQPSISKRLSSGSIHAWSPGRRGRFF